MTTWTLIIIVFMSISKTESVSVTSVAGYKSEDACFHAAVQAGASGEKGGTPGVGARHTPEYRLGKRIANANLVID